MCQWIAGPATYVSEQVKKAVPGQHPILKASDLEDNFPVALDRGGTKSPPGGGASEGENWREIEELMADLYPTGPTDQDIWARAGGELSRLRLGGTGRAAWFAALRTLRLGGGGRQISLRSLLEIAADDFPDHPRLS